MIYITADLHFLHPKIVSICSRPTTPRDHNEWLTEMWNSTIQKKDTVYILGDFSLGNRALTEKILDKLRGTKHLILGNHDRNIRKSTRFESITQIKRINHIITDDNGEETKLPIILCHYPIASWDMKIHGSVHFYGHVHGRFQNAGLSLDVGIDAQDYKIRSIDELMEQLTKRSLDLF